LNQGALVAPPASSHGMQRELSKPPSPREAAGTQPRRPVHLFRRDLRARVEPDGSTSWVHSAGARKLLFGRESAEAFRIQAGVKISLRPQDQAVRTVPGRASFTSRGGEKVSMSLSVRLLSGECGGTLRSLKLANRGDAAKVRVVTVHDPTSLNFRRAGDPPGEIGVNAFNRNDQVVMDDVGDTTGVRVIGFSPRPSVIYMSKDKARVAELLSSGELPGSSFGMSGSVVVATQHDLDLSPGSTAEVRTVSLYHPSSLESALSAASTTISHGEKDPEPGGMDFASSSASVNFAFGWAKAAALAIEGEASLAEKLWSGTALSLLSGDAFLRVAEPATAAFRKDGTLRHSAGSPDVADRAGPLETSLYVSSLCAYLFARSRDKRLLKAWYPRVKKAAEGLCRLASSGLVPCSSDSPDGWRRRLAAGFPSGHTAEVNLIVIRALGDAAALAASAGKAPDSARFNEARGRLVGALNEKLRDAETGAMCLNVDGRGVVHKEQTADQAVGLAFFSPDQGLASSVVHRLLEKDFETGYGPRTVATSNNLYFSHSYADGQLGGYWTRAALSHALLAFSAGHPGIGSLQVEKVARLVHHEAERLGTTPGEFPYWIDTERGLAMGAGSDPVAASRFVEAVVFGEAGLSLGPEGPRLRVPDSSKLRWLVVRDLVLNRRGTVFVGRSSARTFVASSFGDEASGLGSMHSSFPEAARLETNAGVEAVVFWDAATTLLCAGVDDSSAFSGTLDVPLRSKCFSTSLFAQVEELDLEAGAWNGVEQVKALGRAEVRLDLRPGCWRALRFSRVAR